MSVNVTRNRVPGQYRAVSVATVDFDLTAAALTSHFMGREVYRHTRFVVVRNGGRTALVEVAKGVSEAHALFAPVTSVKVLAMPDECLYIRDASVDTGVPSALAAVASARCVVVEGRYEHVSFILDPAPIRILVADVVPPQPAKLVDQARRVLALAEDLPPVALDPVVLDMTDLAAEHPPADHYLLPCRASGFQAPNGAGVSFLDERPPHRDWTLIGCARSRAIHEWFYGGPPAASIETCPRRLFSSDDPLLTKCCLLENANQTEGACTTVVPWGASLALVKQALHDLTTAVDPAWAPA